LGAKEWEGKEKRRKQVRVGPQSGWPESTYDVANDLLYNKP